MLALRRAQERDRADILAAAQDVGVFTPEEVACVDELLEVFLHQPDNHDYTFVVCSNGEDRPLGFACYGPRALTNGTYDLYWLCVARAAQGRGVATALLRHVEEELCELDARLLVAETSSTPPYSPARGFYERHGFRCCARIPHFYRQDDDLVLYAKYFC